MTRADFFTMTVRIGGEVLGNHAIWKNPRNPICYLLVSITKQCVR